MLATSSAINANPSADSVKPRPDATALPIGHAEWHVEKIPAGIYEVMLICKMMENSEKMTVQATLGTSCGTQTATPQRQRRLPRLQSLPRGHHHSGPGHDGCGPGTRKFRTLQALHLGAQRDPHSSQAATQANAVRAAPNRCQRPRRSEWAHAGRQTATTSRQWQRTALT